MKVPNKKNKTVHVEKKSLAEIKNPQLKAQKLQIVLEKLKKSGRENSFNLQK